MGDLQQHFLRPGFAEAILRDVSVAGRSIVEFGAGRGGLTNPLLAAGAKSVEAWEIDPSLGPPTGDPRLTWRVADIAAATEAHVRGRAVAAFPPYGLLPHLFGICASVDDLLLMVPPKHIDRCLAMGMRRLARLDGSAFEPVSTGLHLVVARGFA